ncbi:AAA family ATPase [Bacillus sp. DX4.1]|uniref:AAA family ATPase n=1 Tax=Bacillus sp. DX4.1 TaxID=3055867 RepID=UPI00259FE294|nr:AAA family ATPase [Bacillus sp. DX4.1]MDM5187891.1 AAA family ATPase [Bacillus sp. DX4.1]
MYKFFRWRNKDRRVEEGVTSYRKAKLKLEILNIKKGMKTFVITAPEKENGVYTFTCMIAKIFAEEGKKVLVIDTDYEGANIHHHLQLEKRPSDDSMLDNRISPLIYKSHLKNLYVVPAKVLYSEYSEKENCIDSLKLLFENSHKEFDIVLINAMRFNENATTQLLSSLCDGVIFMIQKEYTRKSKLYETRSIAEGLSVRVIGFAMNNTR